MKGIFYMRIQKIGYSPTFGYNKKLNKMLNYKLDQAKPDDEMANTIRSLNNYCNNTEELIRTSVDEGEEDEFLNAFIRPKVTLADLVDIKYPELNYPTVEYISYLKEIPKIVSEEEAPWQQYIAEELYAFTLDNFEEDEIENGTEDIKITTDKNDKIDKIDKMLEKAGEIPDIVEKFKPTLSSPRGFDSLGGMHELKEELKDKILFPITHPEEAQEDFAEYGKRPPRGIMLYGPPGCGKTSIAEAMAMESGLPLFKLKISKAGSSYINQTSKNYEAVFNYVAECAQLVGKPCFLFIDEIDGLAKGRDNDATSEDLKQMSTLLNLIETSRDRDVIVLGATNKYDIVDDAVKRRFDEQVYIGMPDIETREQILQKTLARWLKGVQLSQKTDDLHEIATKLDDFPASAIVIMAEKAANAARKDGRRNIIKEDFFNAIQKNQNLKIKEDKYVEDRLRKRIGFGRD